MHIRMHRGAGFTGSLQKGATMQIITTAVAVAACGGGTAAVPTTTSVPVVCSWLAGKAQVPPGEIAYNAHDWVSTHWSSWTRKSAHASGTLYWNNCKLHCVRGRVLKYTAQRSRSAAYIEVAGLTTHAWYHGREYSFVSRLGRRGTI